MAYDDPFDLTTPADNDIVSQGDDRIREMKRAISERLLTFFTDFDADPLLFIDGVIPGTALTPASVGTAQLALLSVTAAQIAANTITDGQIEAGGIGTASIADAAITAALLANLSVATANLQDAAVTDAKISTVDGSKINAGSIPTGAYGNISIPTGALEDLAVTAAKIAANTITAAQLANGAVGTAQILDASVTEAKFDSGVAGKFLEMREVDYAFPGGTYGHDSSTTSPLEAFPGLVAGDNVMVAVPQATFSSAAPFIQFFAVAYTDQYKLVAMNLSGGPISIPACTLKVYCLKLSTAW